MRTVSSTYCSNRPCSGGACTESVHAATAAACAAAVDANPRCGRGFSYGSIDGWCDCAPVGHTCHTARAPGYTAYRTETRRAAAERRGGRGARGFALHLHLSGSGGTALCWLARKERERVPKYHAWDCNMWGKGLDSWRTFMIGREERPCTSCGGLDELIRKHKVTFGAVEAPAPGWLDCPGVQYIFLMVEPVRRILKYAHEFCVDRFRVTRPNRSRWIWGYFLNQSCDPMANLRRWYGQAFVTEHRSPWRGDPSFSGTATVSEANLRFLSERHVFSAPLGGPSLVDLGRAMARLGSFTLAAALTPNSSSIDLGRALGWSTHFPSTNVQAAAHRGSRPIADRALSSAPQESIELVRRHNRLDLELYQWLQVPVIRGQRAVA